MTTPIHWSPSYVIFSKCLETKKTSCSFSCGRKCHLGQSAVLRYSKNIFSYEQHSYYHRTGKDGNVLNPTLITQVLFCRVVSQSCCYARHMSHQCIINAHVSQMHVMCRADVSLMFCIKISATTHAQLYKHWWEDFNCEVLQLLAAIREFLHYTVRT